MLTFRELTLADKPVVDRLTALENDRLCEHCFADIFIWRGHYNTQIAFWKDYCLLRMQSRMDGSYAWLAPIGQGDLAEAVALLEQDAQSLGVPFLMCSISEGMKEKLEKALPNRYVYETSEDAWDYIYLAEKLKTLSGSKLQTKRNLANRFQNAYEGRWSFEAITEQNKAEAYAFHLEWGQKNDHMCTADFHGETCAVRIAIDHFAQLQMQGGILRLDGKIIAFTLGCQSGPDTMVVQIEKADGTIDGAYQIINREFVKTFAPQIVYVNREEDLGLPGLRQAKRGYKPVMMGVKYTASRKPIPTEEIKELF